MEDWIWNKSSFSYKAILVQVLKRSRHQNGLTKSHDTAWSWCEGSLKEPRQYGMVWSNDQIGCLVWWIELASVKGWFWWSSSLTACCQSQVGVCTNSAHDKNGVVYKNMPYHYFLQFLDKLYNLLVTDNEELTLTVMLNAFNNILRLVVLFFESLFS